MNKWEYHKEVMAHGSISVNRLNELGAEGWNHYDTINNTFFFKRGIAADANTEQAADIIEDETVKTEGKPAIEPQTKKNPKKK